MQGGTELWDLLTLTLGTEVSLSHHTLSHASFSSQLRLTSTLIPSVTSQWIPYSAQNNY